MKYLIYVNTLAIILLISCSSPYGSLQNKGSMKFTKDNNISYFQNTDFKKALFKINVDIMGNSLSGLVMIKKNDDTTFKVTIFNELGMNFMDMLFSQNKSEVISVADLFNHPIIIEAIKNDIELILMNKYLNCQFQVLINRDSTYTYFKSDMGSSSVMNDDLITYYIVKKESKYLERIEYTDDDKLKVLIRFQNVVNLFPTDILIEHFDFDFKMNLQFINNPENDE